MKQIDKNAVERQFLTVFEVAAATGKNPATVRAWVQNGSLPSARLGRSILIPRGALEAVLQARFPAYRGLR
jgi:excisionase family DNA binding protein